MESTIHISQQMDLTVVFVCNCELDGVKSNVKVEYDVNITNDLVFSFSFFFFSGLEQFLHNTLRHGGMLSFTTVSWWGCATDKSQTRVGICQPHHHNHIKFSADGNWCPGQWYRSQCDHQYFGRCPGAEERGQPRGAYFALPRGGQVLWIQE